MGAQLEEKKKLEGSDNDVDSNIGDLFFYSKHAIFKGSTGMFGFVEGA